MATFTTRGFAVIALLCIGACTQQEPKQEAQAPKKVESQQVYAMQGPRVDATEQPVTTQEAPKPPPLSPHDEDLAALAAVHKTLIQLEGEFNQRREQVKNALTEAVLSKEQATKADQARINSVLRNYPAFLISITSREQAVKVPSFHDKAVKTHVAGALDASGHMFRLQKTHYKALIAGDLDRVEAIVNQSQTLDEEEATHLIEAYNVLGVPVDKIDTVNGGVKH